MISQNPWAVELDIPKKEWKLPKLTKAEIEALLTDDDAYYNGVGRNFLSCSSINHIINTLSFDREPFKTSKELLFGSLVHLSILEPEKVKTIPIGPTRTRNTKAYKRFLADNDIQLALTINEQEKALKCVKALEDAYGIWMHDETEFEVPAVGRSMGMPFKGKADILSRKYDAVFDIKTTGNLDGFNKSVMKFCYNVQACIYMELFNVKNFVFIIVEKNTQRVGTYRPTEKELELARHKLFVLKMIYNNYYN